MKIILVHPNCEIRCIPKKNIQFSTHYVSIIEIFSIVLNIVITLSTEIAKVIVLNLFALFSWKLFYVALYMAIALPTIA